MGLGVESIWFLDKKPSVRRTEVTTFIMVGSKVEVRFTALLERAKIRQNYNYVLPDTDKPSGNPNESINIVGRLNAG